MARRMWTAGIPIALAAALIECVVAKDTFGWLGFAAAGVRNLALIGAVMLIAELSQIRRGARPAGPDTPQELRIELDLCCSPTCITHSSDAGRGRPEDLISMLHREVGELASLSDHLYAMMELAGHEAEVAEETFVRLDDLRWLLGDYVIKGGRVRRLIQLPELLGSIASADQCQQGPPHRGVGAVRANADELLQRIMTTNVVTAEWLLAHRVTLPDPEYLDSNALLGRYQQLQLAPTSVSGDPLYLLTCHIHDFLETVETLDDVEHPMLTVLETQLAKILKAVEREITAAQAFDAAVIALVRELRSADAA